MCKCCENGYFPFNLGCLGITPNYSRFCTKCGHPKFKHYK